MNFHLQSRWKRLSRLDKLFTCGVAIYFALLAFIPRSGFVTFLQFLLTVTGIWIVLRLTRVGLRKAIWRLRNRLIVAYLLIAVVPILLILALAGIGGYMLAQQVAVYLVRSELDRRISAMQSVTNVLSHADPTSRPELLRRTSEIYSDRYPGLVLLIEDQGKILRSPAGSTVLAPPNVAGTASGIASLEGRYYGWSRVSNGTAQFVAATPLTRRYLSELVPGLGDVYFLQVAAGSAAGSGAPSGSVAAPERKGGLQVRSSAPQKPAVAVGNQRFEVHPTGSEAPGAPLPPPVNRFDLDVWWLSLVQVADWLDPAAAKPAVLYVNTRLSALLQIILSQKLDEFQNLLPILLMTVAIAFLVVELVSLIIGVSLTRTITGAVHSLYEGTQRVMQSDFSHRIKVSGRDQLAELSTSFNTMTENLERLLAVAKEKERLQAEIEIAREVQEQLYPKIAPTLRTLQITGRCQPARMVSGDYYDYQLIGAHQLALAIGDVAGKGISAALLMATIQAAMRMELRSSIDSPAPLNGLRLSTARMVSELNKQLHATTSPEKFATFCFAVYDEETGDFTYTNAGHLPPILIRHGEAHRLDINGTVVGAFPMSRYEESKMRLEIGDLLVCFTDGITEPENEYGEMFGEDRLIEVVSKNSDQDEGRIIDAVMLAVRQWTGPVEQPDDMTILLVRKI